eukprot:scaffold37958_cov229-Skeletonema_marinoi.AAC.3
MTSSAADRRRAREEYYRDHNSAHGSSDERVVGTVNLLSSSSSANNSVSSSHHNGGPTVLSHVTEGTTETSSRNSGGSGARSGGGSNNTSNNDPPEIGEDDHYYQEEPPRSNNYNNNGYPSDSAEDDDDEPELRTLATMDTHTFRRLREERRKSKGSDTEGSTRSSTIRHRSQQRSDPRGINQRDKRVRYRGGGGGGHGRNSFDEDDHTDGGSNDSRSMMTDGVSRFSRATHRSNHRSNNNNNMNRSHSSSPTSHQLQMFFIFALGLVLVIKAGIVEVKLEKAQLRGISERVRGGDGYSHLNHLSGDEYYKAPTVMNAEKDDERDVVEGHSPSEAYFNDAVDKLENGGGVYSQGEKEETEDGGEEQQAEQDLEEAEDEGEDILNEDNPAGEQQSPLEFLQSQSQSSLTQDVNLQQQPDVQQQQQQQLLEQSQFQSQLAWGNQQSGEQMQQPQQQNLFVQQQQPQQQNVFAQQQLQQPQQQNQFGYQLNQPVQQQLPAHYQYGHQYGNQQQSFGQQQNQFDQQFNQQNYLQYGQQPQQLQPQYNQQQYNPQQNPQLPQQFEPQLQQDVQQEVFALQSSNEVASLPGQFGNVDNANVNVNSDEPANLPDYAPVGNVDAIDTNTDLNTQQQYNPQQNPQPQQFEPQLQQDVQQNLQQEVIALQSNNEVVSPPDQLGNVDNANVDANSNEAANVPDAIDAANTDRDQSGAEIDRNPVNEDSPAPLPPTDILNNRIVPFDVSRQPRFRGNRKADDQEEASEDVEDAPIQVQPDAYGTVKEAQPVQEKPRLRRPKPDPNNPDLNYKAAVVDDGIAFTNPRLWGAKTLTTPGLRNHLNKNDAKFAPAAAEVG